MNKLLNFVRGVAVVALVFVLWLGVAWLVDDDRQPCDEFDRDYQLDQWGECMEQYEQSKDFDFGRP